MRYSIRTSEFLFSYRRTSGQLVCSRVSYDQRLRRVSLSTSRGCSSSIREDFPSPPPKSALLSGKLLSRCCFHEVQMFLQTKLSLNVGFRLRPSTIHSERNIDNPQLWLAIYFQERNLASFWPLEGSWVHNGRDWALLWPIWQHTSQVRQC